MHVFAAMSDEPPLKKARGDETDWKGELEKVDEEYAIAARKLEQEVQKDSPNQQYVHVLETAVANAQKRWELLCARQSEAQKFSEKVAL